MKITLHTEEGQVVSFDLEPGENAFLTIDGAELPPGASLYLDPSSAFLGFGAYNEDHQWWDYARTLPITDKEK